MKWHPVPERPSFLDRVGRLELKIEFLEHALKVIRDVPMNEDQIRFFAKGALDAVPDSRPPGLVPDRPTPAVVVEGGSPYTEQLAAVRSAIDRARDATREARRHGDRPDTAPSNLVGWPPPED